MNTNNIQTFHWGQIQWFINESMLNVAITTILPGQKQAPHIHYGNEQFIYVLSGSGKQFIDNQYSKKEPGMMFHIRAGSCHETINTSTEPLVELLVSVPIYYEHDFFTEDKSSPFYPIESFNKKINLDEDIKYLYDKLIEPLNVPICIFDNEGKPLIEGKDYPSFCKNKCNIHESIHNCSLYKIEDNYSTPPTKNSSAILCKHGISIFIFPLIYDDSSIGTLKGGHFKENYTNDNTDSDSFITPKSTILSIFQLMSKLRNQIINYYILKNTKMELSTREANLKNTKEKVLNIQINNHFLLNTLNAIASLALKENSFNTYNSIIDLSNIFKYNLKNTNSLVKLEEEIAYVKDYIKLQKLRYDHTLSVALSIDEELNNISVPSNFLQHIIENSFIHGFKNKKGRKELFVKVKKHEVGILISIEDNGDGIKEDTLNKIKFNLINNTCNSISGLKMIYSKLEMIYGKNFHIDIQSIENEGTHIKIFLPSHHVNLGGELC